MASLRVGVYSAVERCKMRNRQLAGEMFDHPKRTRSEEDEVERAERVAQYERITHFLSQEMCPEKVLDYETEIRDLVRIGLHRDGDGIMVRVCSVSRADDSEAGDEFVVEFVPIIGKERVSMPALVFLRTYNYFARDLAS